MTIDSTLAERGARYGKFEDHAKIAMALKQVMRHAVLPNGHIVTDSAGGTLPIYRPGWDRLANDQAQALDTICDKIARILNGDPNYIDNWHDIQGYAKLVEDRLYAARPQMDPGVAEIIAEHG